MNNATGLSAAVMAGSPLPRRSKTPDEQPTYANTTEENVRKDIPKLPNNTASEGWNAESAAMHAELHALRSPIEQRLASSKERIAAKRMSAAARANEKAISVELARELDTLGDLIKNAEGATPSTWDTVKVDAREATNTGNARWKWLKDNVDRTTLSDNDTDGHWTEYATGMFGKIPDG